MSLFSLNGEWQYLQTGSEEADYSQPTADLGQWRKMNLPNNWYLAGLNYQGVISVSPRVSCQTGLARPAGANRFGKDRLFYRCLVEWTERSVSMKDLFQPFSFDVSRRIKYADANVLVVRVNSPSEEFNTVWPLTPAASGMTLSSTSATLSPLSRPVTRPAGQWLCRSKTARYVKGQVFPEQRLCSSGCRRGPPGRCTPANFSENISAWPPNKSHCSLARIPLTSNASLKPASVVALDPGQPNLYTVKLQILMGWVEIASQETVFGFRRRSVIRPV